MAIDILCRRACASDASEISNLYQNIYEGTYPDPMMKDLRLMKAVLSSNEYCWAVAERGGEVVGSTVFRIDVKNRLAKAYGAVVTPDCRGHKITERLLQFGFDHMRENITPVEVIYATTRTRIADPQKLTENLGYKKLGVFPNVHKTLSYETHCLTAFFSEDALRKRISDFNLHPKLQPIYEIVSRECGLSPLGRAEIDSKQESPPDFSPSHNPLKIEAIAAPLFVRHRFLDEKPTGDDHEWFYPFQEPNILLTTPDQSLEVFAYLSEADKHCILIGIRDEKRLGMSRVLTAATQALRDLGARYIEFLMRADETEKIQAAFASQYIPSAYFPAMQLSQGKRFDFAVFSRSFEILDFQGTQLHGLNLEYLKLYFKSWEDVALEPFLRKHEMKKSDRP